MPPPTRQTSRLARAIRTTTGFIERDGVRVFWERYGDGEPTILLMPTWSIVHSRHWKSQIPYLARRYRVVTFDGRGNGRSAPTHGDRRVRRDRVRGRCARVLDATRSRAAVVAGLSMGAGFALRLAVEHPDRVLGARPVRSSGACSIDRPTHATTATSGRSRKLVRTDDGWGKFNAHFWRRDWPGFARGSSAKSCLTEPHSTKQIEDSVGWTLETDADTITASYRAPFLVPPPEWGRRATDEGRGLAFARRVRCPALVVHGTADAIVPIAAAQRLAGLLHAPLVTIEGGGHVADRPRPRQGQPPDPRLRSGSLEAPA